ncbi:hypothetical protein PC129_g22681 [Phytophthora cactorum]|uniref:Uncharacterized protein n=1 Tax=Phytophthora cactorum TaxID=29920 RepID=A0A8T1JJP1_9STRA|nr:hypothetical protein PC117_g25828 [Phytophthora cactorum]KAG3129982.1 hypothetical protein C6341_g23931 [Phytophthora cactorum]KAG3203886.1 hypothetical protein PC129_g22681 [Phytophthora cactorum]KAG4037003.1 hypothetical protein PC123_g27429 [Phytophthora cactorum]KAG4224949.1 hypothetical protein PC116_g26607 [Phytophthora cactorum]
MKAEEAAEGAADRGGGWACGECGGGERGGGEREVAGGQATGRSGL